MSVNYREEYIGLGTHVLRETVMEEADKVGHPVKINANFDVVTDTEQKKLDSQQFPESLMFSVDVNLAQSKKAFLNFVSGLDEDAVYDQLWNLRPHNPHTYEPPIGEWGK